MAEKQRDSTNDQKSDDRTEKIRRSHRFVGRGWALHNRDVQDFLAEPPRDLYDGALCDPPYGLGFMGHGWDKAVPPVEAWSQLLKACKPGAHLLAFGGPRTEHRLACNIEDAGWELRDKVYWVHGEGFPKGVNVGMALEKLGHDGADWFGYGTTLKPAVEPVVLAMKPRQGSFAKNVLKHGCGALNIDGCRVGTSGGTRRSYQAPYPRNEDGSEDRTDWARTGHSVELIDEGRWPANLILDEAAAELLDQQSGHSRSRRGTRRSANSNVGNGKTMGTFRSRYTAVEGYDDEGGASRLFYVAKASRSERAGNDHPTVKPLTLCEYLARLILPSQRETPRRLLVPFSGSGSEMIGGLRAGWEHVTGVEMDRHFCEVAVRRLSTQRQQVVRAEVANEDGAREQGAVERQVGVGGVNHDSQPLAPNAVYHGDCLDLIPKLPDGSINLVVTSPPYAEQRKGQYPGVAEGRYAEFTVGWMARLWAKLADDGSVMIVLDPHVRDGVVADYVLRTQLALREFGWKQRRPLIWHKPDGPPCGHKWWPRHCYEHILWFGKSRKPFCDPLRCGTPSDRVPAKGRSWAEAPNEVGEGVARISDVISVPVALNDKGIDHPARFPTPLAERLIQTCCPDQGAVLDPFCGSGSSLIAAQRLGRCYYGFDLVADYCRLARRRLAEEAGDERMQAAG